MDSTPLHTSQNANLEKRQGHQETHSPKCQYLDWMPKELLPNWPYILLLLGFFFFSFFLSSSLYLFGIFNFTITIFLFLLLPPSLSQLFLWYNQLFSPQLLFMPLFIHFFSLASPTPHHLPLPVTTLPLPPTHLPPAD
jgi:hypothetical protein